VTVTTDCPTPPPAEGVAAACEGIETTVVMALACTKLVKRTSPPAKNRPIVGISK
jgi:hypothetical protein